jgi:hypothetical protein
MGFETQRTDLIVDVFCFYLQLLLTGFANPMVLAINERVVVNAFAIVFSAEVAFHRV